MDAVTDPADVDATRRTRLAAERTWLAWWRAALGAGVGALGVGRVAPEVLGVARGPYVVLGVGYGILAIALLIAGAYRQRALQRAVEVGAKDPMSFRLVASFTVASAVLALLTIGIVLAHA